jgi:hypothetical protein
MNEIGKAGNSGIQGLGQSSNPINTGNAMELGKSLNAGMGKSLEETGTGIGNTKFANFDPKAMGLGPLSKIETAELAQLGKPFNAVRAQLLPDKPGRGLINANANG